MAFDRDERIEVVLLNVLSSMRLSFPILAEHVTGGKEDERGRDVDCEVEEHRVMMFS